MLWDWSNNEKHLKMAPGAKFDNNDGKGFVFPLVDQFQIFIKKKGCHYPLGMAAFFVGFYGGRGMQTEIYVDFLFYFAIFESLETTLAAVTTVLPLL